MKQKIGAEYVRKNFPTCVAFADECRQVFGDGVRMVYALEGDKEIGKQSTGDHVTNLVGWEPQETKDDDVNQRR